MSKAMARGRKAGNSDLPPFVYFNEHSYYYKHPLTGKIAGLGSNREVAVERGGVLNYRIWGNDRRRLRELRSSTAKLEGLLDEFAKHRKARVGPVTFEGDATRIKQYKRWFDRSPALITIEDINKRLDGAGRDVVRQHKILLRQFFEYCRSKGAIGPTAPNHADLIIIPPRQKKRRRRLTLDWFWQIYRHRDASIDLQTAMIISLITSMRRTDLVRLERANFDRPFIRYIPSKTSENPDPMPTECEFSAQAWARYIAPALLRAGDGQVIPRSVEWLTRQFSAISSQVTQLESGIRPTLHEVRALSDDLYRKQGDDKDLIRQRNAHRSVRTTDVYLAGHDGIVYNRVPCKLHLEHVT